jgi:hypothetical protein
MDYTPVGNKIMISPNKVVLDKLKTPKPNTFNRDNRKDGRKNNRLLGSVNKSIDLTGNNPMDVIGAKKNNGIYY